MKRLSLVLLIFLSLNAIATDEIEVPRSVRKGWGGRNENIIGTALLYVPRLLGYTIRDVLTSRTVRRVTQVAKGSYEMTQDIEKGGYQLAESVLNVPGTVHDVGSDTVGLVKNVVSAVAHRTSRIQLCTTNLMSNYRLTGDAFVDYSLHFINPTFHIGAVIDEDMHETTDALAYKRELRGQNDRGGMSCHDVPIYSDDTVNMAIERLTCTDYEFYESYDLFYYNCGGYTKDVLNIAGLGYPQGVNWGVGSEFKSVYNKSRYKRKKKDVAKYCDAHVKKVQSFFYGIETGADITDDFDYFMRSNYEMSISFYLQTIVSGARSGNYDVFKVAERFRRTRSMKEIVLNKFNKVSFKYKVMLGTMVKDFKEEMITEEVEARFPEASEILRQAIKQFNNKKNQFNNHK